MPSHSPRLGLVAALCMLPLAVAAQPDAQIPPIPTLQDVVVTASRSPEPLADAVGDVTVIGPRQLQAAQGDSIAQVIAQAPGVQFVTNGGPQTATGIYLRGANANQTLVLVDGIRINGATYGGTQFPTIDPALVERIEILRGAASSLYGSDAIGGVINIITKNGEDAERPLSAWANVGLGSYDTAKSSLGISGASHGWDYSLSSSVAASRGFDIFRPRFADGSSTRVFGHDPDKDGYRSHALSGAVGYRWAEGHRIGLTAYNSYMDGDTDINADVPNDYVLYRQQIYGLDSSDRITDWWHSDLHVGFARDSAYNRTGPDQSVFGSISRQYSWTNTFTPHTGQQLAVLLERREERVQGDTAFTHDARDTNAAALIYKGQFDRLRIQASARNDSYTGYGNEPTGSLGLDIELSSAWQVGVLGSTGFRAPSFNDLYYPGFFGLYPGNPNLEPEKSRNIEAHVDYHTDQTQLRLTLFQNKIKNLIATSSNFPYAPANINSATLRGLTLAGTHHFGATTVRGSIDLMDPRNDSPAAGQDAQLPLRARQVFHLSATRRIQALQLGAEYEYTGNRIDAVTRAHLGGYALVNLTAGYDLTKSLGVQVRWNNVLDRDYELVDGYATPGSNVFVNLSWKM